MVKSTNPILTIEWKDPEGTGALGWIVIHNEVGGVSGGGLFMDESATLKEVKDLAQTMALKNSLQDPVFGGGKGGIRFSPIHQDAPAVLERFLKDHAFLIQNRWCTGGDLHTTTKQIAETLCRVSDVSSPFIALARYVEKKTGNPLDVDRFHKLLSIPANNVFAMDEIVTGYSVASALETVEKATSYKPRVVIQGFGKVGRAAAFALQKKALIVGICEHNWSLYDPDGIDVESLLDNNFPAHAVLRSSCHALDDFFEEFLKKAKADVFCPCAVRYCITEDILRILRTHTFSESKLEMPCVIAGANNIFAQKNLVDQASLLSILVVPEWVSNVGSALLFMEALKYQGVLEGWPLFIKQEIDSRIQVFLRKAKIMVQKSSISLYDACTILAHEILDSQEKAA